MTIPSKTCFDLDVVITRGQPAEASLGNAAEPLDRSAMESTGVYWIPLYELLEQNGIEACLVNADRSKCAGPQD